MFNLRGISMKLFRAGWPNVVATICTIAISTCLIMTMMLYSFNAKQHMADELYKLFGNVDLMVGYNPGQQQYVTTEQYVAIKDTEGVESTSKASLVFTDVDDRLHSVYTLGVENDKLVKSRYHFTANLTEHDVIVSQTLAETLKVHVGEAIQINGSPFTIREILSHKGIQADAPQMLLVSNNVAKQWMSAKSNTEAMFVMIKTEDAANVTETAVTLKALDEALRVDVTAEDPFIQMNVRTLSIFIIVLSVLILAITGVLLLSNFQLLFYKMKQQFIIMRSLGATSQQVGKIVSGQLTTMNVVGVTFGTVITFFTVRFGLQYFVSYLGLPESNNLFLVVPAFITAGICFVVLQLFVWIQVQQSLRILPMQLMTNNERIDVAFSKKKRVAITLLTIVSLLLMFMSQLNQDGRGALLLLIGALLFCLTLILIFPLLLSNGLKAIMKPAHRLFGKEVALAIKNMMPQVKSNTSVVLSIIFLMVILIFGSSIMKTLQQNEEAYLTERYETPIIVTNTLGYDASTDLDIQQLLRDVKAISTVQDVYAKGLNDALDMKTAEGWKSFDFSAINMAKMVELGKIDHFEGEYEEGIVISKQFAKDHDLSLGDKVEIGRFQDNLQDVAPLGYLTVAAITREPLEMADLYVDWSVHLPFERSLVLDELFVQTSDEEKTMFALEELKKMYPELTIGSYKTSIEEADRIFHQRWGLFAGVLLILIAATCLGVFQSLVHYIYSKRQDYAIQRLIGLTPNQLVKLIVTQILLFITYSIVAGSIVGCTLTYALAMIDSTGTLYFDVQTITMVSVGFIVLSVLLFAGQGWLLTRQKLIDEIH
ncbi:ABC transporter permease [Peribacillus frigoritolerans]|uniref:ABC transporter permease n=1 Tax=Peribacillus frigoritolerans TaxID=450367 RepID=UPI001F4F4ED8|nr:ABC transporter permease [Peribacillus frigoritolerans]MCK2019823.1 FtsX-like permease family protein [Peribacillus frigoritolerans]